MEKQQSEQERLVRLKSYDVLDTLPEQEFDDLVRIAAEICDTPIALISLVDDRRQWFKARLGLEAGETPRAVAFCHHAIQRPEEVMVVEDATRDDRFENNPLVTGHPDIRFYAGAPLTTRDGHCLGTICVIDTEARRLEQDARLALEALGRQVMVLLEYRRDRRLRDLQQQRMRRLYEITSHITGRLEDTLDELLREGTTMLGMDLGIISRITGDSYRVQHFFPEESGLQRGQEFSFKQTYCEITFSKNGVNAIDHMGKSNFSSHPCYEAFKLEAYIGVPIFVRGEPYGTLNFSSPNPRLDRNPGLDEDFVQAMGQWVGAAIERAEADERTQRLSALLEAAPQLIGIDDANGKPGYLNPGGRDMLGWGPEEQLPDSFRHLHTSESAERMVKEGLPTARAKGMWSGESTLRARDGEEIPVLQVVIYQPDQSMDGGAHFATICQDIRKLKEVDRLKSEFISTVSHELRTPLTSIRGGLGLMAGGALGEFPEKARTLIDLAANNADRLVRLINDILEIEKIESGRIDYNFQFVDLIEIMKRAVSENEEYATKFDTRFEIHTDMDSAVVRGDADRIRQIFDNLLSNAAKFTASGTVIDVTVQRHGDSYRVAVRDRGTGIPPEFQASLFEKFTQSDASTSRTRGGTGLGLSISQAIARAHDTRIQFETSSAGTTFFVDFRSREAGAAAEAGRFRSGRKILVLEDDPDVGRLLVMMLETSGHTAARVGTAREARERIERESFDGLTLDLKLPDQDGLEFLSELRQTEYGRDLPVIVVSIRSPSSAHDLEGQALRLHDWIEKPIDQERLLNAVATVTRREGLPRILHIEDDADFAAVVRLTLEEVGDVEYAGSYAAAVERLQHQDARLDLILLDLGLADGSGLEIIPLIREHHPGAIVVILTGQDVATGIAGEVHAILEKSRTNNEDLVAQISRLLAPDSAGV